MSGGSIREAWIRWRNARLSDPAFQRWAADFPLTRPVARRRAGAVFDLVAGFVYSRVLGVLVEFDLLKRARSAPVEPAALEAELGLDRDAADRLFGAACALGLLERMPDGRFALGAKGAEVLGAPGLEAMIRHNSLLYSDLARTDAMIRAGEAGPAISGFWPYARDFGSERAPPGAAVDAYSALMAATQPAVAADVLDAYPLGRRRALLDVGGGEGVFVSHAAARAPGLDLAVFDLPEVIARARARLAAQGLLDRTRLHAGDFTRDPLPGGADLISFVRVLHDHDDATVRRLLASARAAVGPGGRVLVAEPMATARRREGFADAYFTLYLLAMGRGRPRTARELGGMLLEAGFARVREVRTRQPFLLRALEARA